MSKTAEEILVEHRVFMTTDTIKTFNLNVTRDCGIGTSKWIMNSMREFAAQEVEEYKARLKRLIEDQRYSNSSMSELSFPQIIGLIDTVK